MAPKYQENCLWGYCDYCQEETQHAYSYQSPYPDLRIKIAGSERKTCQKCKKRTPISDGEYNKAVKRYREEVLPFLSRQN
ncbi:MAG: hypothetical protein VE96_C0003G0010 [candidate division Kazan bacterium GW2011_GWA1_44_22]|uniref:Uncharacterized protein n=1 Tax=candidate division Kazan bacterium GW2011_GWA1_44_22 TaxID=1620410 RepID=A0A0G1I1I2_UNCK3|nr:MAG: hypothetical protein VE96_C0003G0010 [candidate division Kazan bacterium GW2011_GWA1_44_22]